MMRLTVSLLLAATAPVMAQTLPPDDGVSGAQEPMTQAERSVPAQLTPQQRYQYRRIFLDIDSGRISAARTRLATMPRGPLHGSAEAEILLVQGSNAGLMTLTNWLKEHPAAPQARQISALARKAGASSLPPLAQQRRFVPISLTPPQQPRSARGSSTADREFATGAGALINAHTPREVAALATRYGDALSADVRAEWLYRAAWDSYIDLDDTTARYLGTLAANGTGDWSAMGNWVGGLASFRQNDCESAARHFDAIGKQYTLPTVRAGAAYWAARSHVRCGRPEMAGERLRAAIGRDKDGFYGLLAARALGIAPDFNWQEPDFIQADWTTLRHHKGAQRAAALVEIGQLGLADRELRQLAATSSSMLYEPIMRLAARLNLPATQYWLAQNPPPGMMPTMADRLPTPEWRPFDGWRVDRNLVFAHALQESKFITSARSGPGARGVMQLMPGTAREIARAAAITHSDELLADPEFNVEYGQRYLEYLRDNTHTNGLLPKVIAAYNAGPGSVANWNSGGIRDNGDVLLYIESIPFRETRHYVSVVLRNYWLYGLKDAARQGKNSSDTSLTAVAAHQWPRFPGRESIVPVTAVAASAAAFPTR